MGPLVLNGVWAGLLEGIKSKTRGQTGSRYIFSSEVEASTTKRPHALFLAPVCTLLGCNGFGLTECHVHHALWSGGSLDDGAAIDMKLGR